MRYAAISTALFGAAMFMAPGGQTAASTSHAAIPAVILSSQHSTPQLPLIRLASQPTMQTLKTQAATKPAATTGPTLEKPVLNQTTAAQPAPEVMATVAAGDNLTSLAEANNTTYRRLYDANPAVVNPDLIYPGQSLRVPTAGETLPERDLPVNAPAAAVAEAVRAVTPTRSTDTSPVSAAADGSVWDQLAICESGGNWAINTGNGFYGGIQFTLATWQGLGGTGLPSQASREEQIAKGEMLLARSGWGQWPACSAKLGLR